jgi:hypothetical protein
MGCAGAPKVRRGELLVADVVTSAWGRYPKNGNG